MVEREGHLGVGATAKDDESDPVPFAAFDKLVQHRFDRGQTYDTLPVTIHKIRGLHGLRNIHGQQQVASGGYFLNGVFDPLRSGHCGNKQKPKDGRNNFLQQVRFEDHRPRCWFQAGSSRQLFKKRDAH